MLFRVLLLGLAMLCFHKQSLASQPVQPFPFSTNATQLTIWDGEKYVPFTVKGTNLGIAVPGMPIGSPGMDGPEYGGRQDPYDVLLVGRDGNATVYASYHR